MERSYGLLPKRAIRSFLFLLLICTGTLHSFGQRNVRVSADVGLIKARYGYGLKSTPGVEGQIAYGAQILYAEPAGGSSEIAFGIGYHVQNVLFETSGGGLSSSYRDSMDVKASYLSLIFGPSWYLDKAEHFSLFPSLQFDVPLTNMANGRRRSSSFPNNNADYMYSGKLENYGKVSLIPTLGFNYQRTLSFNYQIGIGAYVQYGLGSQWEGSLRTIEGGLRIFVKRNFPSKVDPDQGN